MNFQDLCRPENIAKLNIDEALIPAFTKVMIKLHTFFTTNGYYQLRDYSALIEQYLLSQDDNSCAIMISDDLKAGWQGSFTKGVKPPTIKIAGSLLEGIAGANQERVESTLCHELIHFLVMTNQDTRVTLRNGFFNEALTELLTQQIYPTSNAYIPQVKFQQFSNFLTNNVNDFQSFLRGYVPGIVPSSSAQNMVAATERYMNDSTISTVTMSDAEASADYQAAQKHLIDMFYADTRKKLGGYSVDEYLALTTDILRMAPVQGEPIETFLARMDLDYISSIFPSHLVKLTDEQIATFATQLSYFRIVNRSKIDGYCISETGEFQTKADPNNPYLITEIMPISGNYSSHSKTASRGGYTGVFSTDKYPNCTYKVDHHTLHIFDENGLLIDTIDITSALLQQPQSTDTLVDSAYETFRAKLSKSTAHHAMIGSKILEETPDVTSIQEFQLINYGKAHTPLYVAVNAEGINIYNRTGNQVPFQIVEEVKDVTLSLYKGITAKQNGLVMYEDLGVAPVTYKCLVQLFSSQDPIEVMVYFDGQKFVLAKDIGYNRAMLAISTPVYDQHNQLATNEFITPSSEHITVR